MVSTDSEHMPRNTSHEQWTIEIKCDAHSRLSLGHSRPDRQNSGFSHCELESAVRMKGAVPPLTLKLTNALFSYFCPLAIP